MKMNEEKEYASEAIAGFIISFIVIALAPLGMILSLAGGVISVFLLVPGLGVVISYINSAMKFTFKTVGIKYLAGFLTVAFVGLMEDFFPSFVVVTLIMGIGIYIFTGDIHNVMDAYKRGSWKF